MKIVITQAIIAAYLAKNTILKESLPANEQEVNAFIGQKLGEVAPYFNDHPAQNAFLVTADGMVFFVHDEHTVKNHAATLDNKVILFVDREDVAEVLAAMGETEKGIPGNDYTANTVKELKALCDKQGIEYAEKATKAQLIQLLLDNTGKVAIEPPAENTATDADNNADVVMIQHEVTQEDLDRNPDLVAEGVKVGDTIEIDPKDLVAPLAEIDYEALTVDELKKEAEKLGIIIIKNWKKADYIEAIKATLNGTGNVQK